MKKWMQVVVISVMVILSGITIDLLSVFTRNKPIFAISKESNSVDKVYLGLLYNTYNCYEKSSVYIMPKWVNHSCK